MDTQPEHWILLRGLIRSRFHWGGFPALLEQSLQTYSPGLHLLTPELAGNGERWQEKTPLSIHHMMLDIRRQVLPRTAVPLTIVAVSMGAMIAAEWARCFPQEIRALHLINTSFSNLSRPWQRLRAPALFSLLQPLIRGASQEAAILRWTTNMTDTSVLLPAWESFARQHPLSLRNAFAQLLAASRYCGPTRAPVTPVYCYHSLADQLVSPACTARIARAWQVPLFSHPAAGHDLPLDDPQWLISQILQTQLASREYTSACYPASDRVPGNVRP